LEIKANQIVRALEIAIRLYHMLIQRAGPLPTCSSFGCTLHTNRRGYDCSQGWIGIGQGGMVLN